MKNSILLILIALIFVIQPNSSWAQEDASNTTLLMSSPFDPSAYYSSASRFKAKQAPPPKEPAKKAAVAKAVKTKPKRDLATQPIDVTDMLRKEPSLKEQLTSLIDENGPDHLEQYRDSVHPDDVRLNRLEIQVSPGVFSNNSQSNYSFREYGTSSPHLDVAAGLWLTPDFGLYGKTGTTLGAAIPESNTSSNQIGAKFSRTELAFSLRKFFGMTRKANSISYGLFYLNDKMILPSDASTRSGSELSGFGLQASSRFPVAPTLAWTFGAQLIPRLNYSESSTALNLQSGDNPQGSRFGLDLGAEIKLSRKHQLILEFEANYDKFQFEGRANQIDPVNSQTPSGVSVSNTSFLLNVGYRWGL